VLTFAVGQAGIAYIRVRSQDVNMRFMEEKWFLIAHQKGFKRETPLEFMIRNLSFEEFWTKYAGDVYETRLSRYGMNHQKLLDHVSSHETFHKEYHLIQSLRDLLGGNSGPQIIRDLPRVTGANNRYFYPFALALWCLAQISRDYLSDDVTQMIVMIMVEMAVE